MVKEFIPFNVMRNNALKLAHHIAETGFIPDVIYVSLRGGAYMGNIISEYFKLHRKGTGARPIFYAAVVAHSYTDVRESTAIRIDGWTYDPAHLRTGDKVLFVDDIFDTGKTINHLVNVILERGVPRRDIKVVVHDYKVYADRPLQTIEPDFFCRKLEISKPEEDRWIHYMSHELVGLTQAELEEYYYKDDPDLRRVLSIIK